MSLWSLGKRLDYKLRIDPREVGAAHEKTEPNHVYEQVVVTFFFVFRAPPVMRVAICYRPRSVPKTDSTPLPTDSHAGSAK